MRMLASVSVFLLVFIALLITSITVLYPGSFNENRNLLTGAVTEFVYVPPPEITEAIALEALIKAENDIKEVASLDVDTFLLSDTLLIAKRSFIGPDPDRVLIMPEEENKRAYLVSLIQTVRSTPKHELKPQNFSDVIRLTQLISFRKDQSHKILDRLAVTEEKEKKYVGEGVDTSAGVALIAQTRTSLYAERFDEAETLLDDANLKLDQARLEEVRFRNIFKGTANFFQRYWWQSILIFIVLAISSPYLFLAGRKLWAARKLDLIKKEHEVLKGLLIKAQEDCFKNRTITSASYKVKSESYKTRMNEIQRTIPVLEAIIKGEKKGPKKEKNLFGLKIK
jgi:hypothetical protein